MAICLAAAAAAAAAACHSDRPSDAYSLPAGWTSKSSSLWERACLV